MTELEVKSKNQIVAHDKLRELVQEGLVYVANGMYKVDWNPNWGERSYEADKAIFEYNKANSELSRCYDGK